MVVTDEGLAANQTNEDNPSWARALNRGGGVLWVIWRGLRYPWLLISSGGIVLLLVLSSYYLQQLPSQLNDDPLATARWLMTVSADYGLFGDFLRGLGLFDLLHSPLLYLLFTLIGLILLVHLGDLMGAAWRLHRMTKRLPTEGEAASAGIPLLIPTPQPVYRWRQAQPALPAELAQRLRDQLAANFDYVATMAVAFSTQAAPTDTTVPEPIPSSSQEVRLFASRHLRWAMARPLFMLGLLVLWFVIWLILTFGWAVMPASLAPGAEYRYAAHELVLQYQATEQANTLKPELAVHVGEGSYAAGCSGCERTGRASVSLPAALPGRTRIGSVEVTTTPGAPGLLLSTVSSTVSNTISNSGQGEPLLQRPGQSNRANAIGLVFPNPGSEESVVLPDQAVVLRIVRMPDSANGAFTVEIQDNDKRPVQHLQINKAKRETLQLNGKTVVLRFVPLPSLDVAACYVPDAWLLWLALVLILLGAVGFWYQPAFILAQLAPWPKNRTVLVVQSDVQREVDAVRRWVGEWAEDSGQ